MVKDRNGNKSREEKKIGIGRMEKREDVVEKERDQRRRRRCGEKKV